MLRGEADLNVYSWNVEDCGLHVVGFGLQGGGAFLAGQEVGGGGVGGLQLLLLGGRLLVQTPGAALTAPTQNPQGDIHQTGNTSSRVGSHDHAP